MGSIELVSMRRVLKNNVILLLLWKSFTRNQFHSIFRKIFLAFINRMGWILLEDGEGYIRL